MFMGKIFKWFIPIITPLFVFGLILVVEVFFAGIVFLKWILIAFCILFYIVCYTLLEKIGQNIGRQNKNLGKDFVVDDDMIDEKNLDTDKVKKLRKKREKIVICMEVVKEKKKFMWISSILMFLLFFSMALVSEVFEIVQFDDITFYVPLFFLIVNTLSILVLNFRIYMGYYGSNDKEIREIISYIIKNRDDLNNGDGNVEIFTDEIKDVFSEFGLMGGVENAKN
jgi:hypothetical protein